MGHRLTALFLCVAAFMLCASRADAQGNTNIGEFSVLFWMPDPELTLQSGALETATGITEIDFVQEFGIEKKRFPELRLVLGRGHKFRFSYVPVRYEAETIIQRTITFRGQTFVIGAPAATEINWDIWRFGYEWDFVSRERGFVGLIGELKYNTLDAGINSPVLASAVETEQRAPIPTFGIAGRGYLHPMFAIGGELTALSLDIEEDFEGEALDFDINGLVTFGPNVGVQAGYRSVKVEYETEDDLGNLKLKGLYFGAIVKF